MQVVTIDARGRALQRVAHVSKSANEELMWVAIVNGGPWKVTFDKGTPSPFSQATYIVPPGGPVQTNGGPLNGDVNGTYKYNVRDANTDVITDDPDVDIDP
jgi:hypothetical protein